MIYTSILVPTSLANLHYTATRKHCFHAAPGRVLERDDYRVEAMNLLEAMITTLATYKSSSKLAGSCP